LDAYKYHERNRIGRWAGEKRGVEGRF